MGKRSKIFLIVGLLLIVIFIIFIIFKITRPQLPAQPPITPSPSSEFPTPSPTDEKMSVKTITGDTISLNNVYRQPIENLSQNGVAFAENSNYYMAYYPKDQAFIITLLDPNLTTARDDAESVFLTTLGIDKDTACTIKVVITVPYDVSAAVSGQEYGLSFCPGSLSF